MSEVHEGGTTVTGEHIPLYRLHVMRQGLKLEIKGMSLSRSPTCYSIAKREFGFKGNRAKVLAQLEDHIAAYYPL
jgi:hypothetical protein